MVGSSLFEIVLGYKAQQQLTQVYVDRIKRPSKALGLVVLSLFNIGLGYTRVVWNIPHNSPDSFTDIQ